MSEEGVEDYEDGDQEGVGKGKSTTAKGKKKRGGNHRKKKDEIKEPTVSGYTINDLETLDEVLKEESDESQVYKYMLHIYYIICLLSSLRLRFSRKLPTVARKL
jgi:hypothetical protein